MDVGSVLQIEDSAMEALAAERKAKANLEECRLRVRNYRDANFAGTNVFPFLTPKLTSHNATICADELWHGLNRLEREEFDLDEKFQASIKRRMQVM